MLASTVFRVNKTHLYRNKNMKNFQLERYQSGMVLSGTGDALGYRNGLWEFERNGENIHRKLKADGGIENLKVKPPEWIVSDDTVMHLATAEALIQHDNDSSNDNELYRKIAESYVECMKNMNGRGPGLTCMEMCQNLKPSQKDGFRLPFNPRGGGCGAAMRSMCIGLRYPRPEDLDNLIAVSIESGRMTHHHPTGYLGSLASALFTSYAVQGVPLREWGSRLLDILNKAKEYIVNSKYYVDQNIESWDYFERKWTYYLDLRRLRDGTNEAIFPPDHGTVKKRDQFYSMLSFDGWGGASGHDAPMIAYDALLACQGNWSELCNRAMFHGGDSDSTGVIAGCLYGILYGTDDVPKGNYESLEYRERLENAGEKLFKLAETTDHVQLFAERSGEAAKQNTLELVDFISIVFFITLTIKLLIWLLEYLMTGML